MATVRNVSLSFSRMAITSKHLETDASDAVKSQMIHVTAHSTGYFFYRRTEGGRFVA